MLLNFNPNIKRVTIEYVDGTVDTFDIPAECGFVREGYTYEQKLEGSDKVTAILHTYEIYWAERKENGDAYDFGASQTHRRVS